MNNFNNKKLRIAVIFENSPFAGGNFQVEYNSLFNFEKIKDNNFEFLFFSTNKNNLDFFKKKNIEIFYININFLEKVKIKIFNFFNIFKFLSKFEKILLSKNIDFVHFNSVSLLALKLKLLSFGVHYWDSCHLDHPEFPEVKTGNSFEIREKSYSLILKKSSYVIADSLESRDNLASRYNIIQKKIFTIPMLPNFFVLDFINNFKSMENVQVPKIKYNIKRDYIFYPAQFLPHKNHIYILEAVKILKDNNILIDVIFAGRERINLEYIAEAVNKFSLQDQVKIIGAVDSEYLPYLYRDSLALVMPTYFGPTNLPPIEAMALGVPVIYSDLFFNNEQVKDLVLPINLKDPHTLCDAIKNLLSNKTLKEELISRGKNHILQLINNHNQSIKVLKSIYLDFFLKRKCWDRHIIE
jgi:glycosyltransferase involved in cell wall biosynthesis